MEMLVGLARIELATSSLSGMRSNQLSYSPDLKRGLSKAIPAQFRQPQPQQFDHFFFKHRNSHATNEIGDQVENDRCQKHP